MLKSIVAYATAVVIAGAAGILGHYAWGSSVMGGIEAGTCTVAVCQREHPAECPRVAAAAGKQARMLTAMMLHAAPTEFPELDEHLRAVDAIPERALLRRGGTSAFIWWGLRIVQARTPLAVGSPSKLKCFWIEGMVLVLHGLSGYYDTGDTSGETAEATARRMEIRRLLGILQPQADACRNNARRGGPGGNAWEGVSDSPGSDAHFPLADPQKVPGYLDQERVAHPSAWDAIATNHPMAQGPAMTREAAKQLTGQQVLTACALFALGIGVAAQPELAPCAAPLLKLAAQ